MIVMSSRYPNTDGRLTLIENRLGSLFRNHVLILISIGVGALIIRLFYFPFDIPIILDGLAYFWYAIDMSVLGSFPTSINFPNNGWPSFVSIFFSILPSNDFLDFMNLQRMLSSIISVLTIIPVYLLCRKFFEKTISIVGAVLFVLDPRIILNSFLGITEPLFVLLGTTSLFLFFSSNRKIVYLSFAVAALFSLVRYEGLLIIIPMSVMFFVRFRKDTKIILRYLIAFAIFVLVLSPMVMVRMETMGFDGLTSHLKAGATVVITYNMLNDDPSKRKFFPDVGIINLTKYLGWVMIPTFIIFIPLGLIELFKNRDFKKNSIILFLIFFLIPGFYAYSRGILDTRYLFDLFPLFSIISLFTVNFICSKFHKKNLVCLIIILSVLGTSWISLDFKDNSERQREAYLIALENQDRFSAINDYYPESVYNQVTVLDGLEEFPTLRTTITPKIKPISVEGYQNLDEFIESNKKNGLKYLVIDDSPTRPKFLRDILDDQTEISYLSKVYDSSDSGFKYYLKVFEIDYEKFDNRD